MFTLLKSETRRDFAKLSAALFKFFLVQTLLSALHVFKAFKSPESVLFESDLVLKVLAILALVFVIIGALGAKRKQRKLIAIAAFYLFAHTTIGVIEDFATLKSNFDLPKSLLNIFTLFLGLFMGLFQFYCTTKLWVMVDDTKKKP